MKIMIPWYYNDKRFEPATVADIGHVLRLTIQRTKRQSNNKWNLYISVRTVEENSVKADLKKPLKVAEYTGSMTLEEVHKEVEKYMEKFLYSLIGDLVVREN